MSNQDDQKKTAADPRISNMILDALKPRTGRETSKWIVGLADEIMPESVEQPAQPEIRETPAASASGSIPRNHNCDAIHVLDHLFDCFQQYEYDFNRTVMGSELVISIDRPQLITETLKQPFHASETVQTFRGRLSTRKWTLLIRARNELIEGWIIPIDKLISFTADHNAFVRFLRMEGRWKNDQLCWFIDGVEISWDNLRLLAKQLFGSLINVARGEASDSEPFMLSCAIRNENACENMLIPATEPVPPISARPSYSFDEHNPSFESPYTSAGPIPTISTVESLAAQRKQSSCQQGERQATLQSLTRPPEHLRKALSATDQPDHVQAAQLALNFLDEPPAAPLPANTPEPDKEVTIRSAEQHALATLFAQQAARPQAKPFIQSPLSPPAAPEPAASASVVPEQLCQPSPPPSPVMAGSIVPTPVSAPAFAPDPDRNHDCPDWKNSHEHTEFQMVLDMLNSVVAFQLDQLFQSGAEAFSRQDLVAVERAMKRATRLKDLQIEVIQQVQQWNIRLLDTDKDVDKDIAGS